MRRGRRGNGGAGAGIQYGDRPRRLRGLLVDVERRRLSPDAPLTSLAAASSVVLEPGAQLLLRAGTKCVGVLEPQGSGSAAAPIVIGRYGAGVRPVVEGGGAAFAVRLRNQSWVTIQDLAVTNAAPQRGRRTGVQVEVDGDQSQAGIVLQRLEVANVAGWGDKTGANASWFSFSAGIIVLGKASEATIDGLTIVDNDIHDTGGGGIKVSNNPGGPYTGYHTNVHIARNTIRDVGGDGIVVHRSDAPLVEHNVAHDLGHGAYPFQAGNFAGMWAIGSRNPVFQYNEVSRSRPSAFDSTAWDCDGGIVGTCLYQYNYSHGNAGGFYLDCLDCTAHGNSTARQVLRYNVAQDDCRIKVLENSRLEMYNNTFWCSSAKLDLTFSTATADALIANNIFVAAHGAVPATPGVDYRANTYWGGIVAPSTDLTASTADPRLRAGGTGRDGFGAVRAGYRLTTGSPAYGTGVAVDGEPDRDFFGQRLGTTRNRGAHGGEPVEAIGTVPTVAAAYNNVGTTRDQAPTTGGLSLSRWTFSDEALAAAGWSRGAEIAVDGFTVRRPDVAPGQVDNVKAAGQRIALHGRAERLAVVGYAVGADAIRTIRLDYADGTSEEHTIALDDWWHSTSDVGAQLVVRTGYHNSPPTDYRNPLSGRAPNEAHVWLDSVPVDPSKRLVAVTLPDDGPLATTGLHVIDLVLDRVEP